jgi:hypothetical protein
VAALGASAADGFATALEGVRRSFTAAASPVATTRRGTAFGLLVGATAPGERG